MNKVKLLKAFIIILLLLCIIMLIFTIFAFKDISQEYIEYKEEPTDNFTNNVDIEIMEKEYKSVEELLEQNDIELLSIKDNIIRVTFPKDLYDEDGKSNEKFFRDLINKMSEFYGNKSFTLLDITKNIKIYAKYNSSNEEYELIINDINDYFEKVDGELYTKVDNVRLKKSSNIYTDNSILFKLGAKNSYFSAIESLVKEDEKLEDGYVSYNDGQIKIRQSLIGTVRHIIFTSKYEGKITSKIDVNTPLKDILEIYPENSFGSIDEGYLGYITNDYYYFFYRDEISIYSYTYEENKQFEKLLKSYLESKDLDKFISGINSNYRVYDYLEYDSEIQKAYVLFANRGIEIDIEENNPKGITLYNNYNFSDDTKKYVREGMITLNSNEDLVNKKEIERRKQN